MTEKPKEDTELTLETTKCADDTSSDVFLNEAPDSKNNPFANEKFAQRYAKVYEDAKYECRHRFDPDFKWTKEQQRKLNWKLDFKVTFVACLFFCALQMDRGNLGQAVSDNLLNDLNLSTNDFNTGNTIFYCCFLGAELPSQLISKRVGADIWIPIQITVWSIVTICQFRLSGKAGFFVCRALLGFFEGGFVPDLVLWLSYFYTGAELTIRLTYFWCAMYFIIIINYLIAYGILHMRGILGHPGWAWLFLIEGLITLCVGISAFFLMRPSCVSTKRFWNKKGWFTEEEEKIIVNKILRDDPTKGDMHNRQGLSFKMIFDALLDWHLWPMYLIGLFAYIPETTVDTYMTLLLRSMGFSTFHTNLLCIPYNALKILTMLFVSYLSEYLGDIFNVALMQPIWTTVCLGVLRFWSGSMINKWGTYVVLTFMLADPMIHAMMVSACSRNASSIKTRTVSASLYNMFVQAGSIIASNIYRTPDAPLYHKGNSILFGLSIALIPVLSLTKVFYCWLNKRKAIKWDKMSETEHDSYIENTNDSGSKRLDYRFSN
ncbi:hypothetical protein CANINC_004154 [Pichia inconspicua]|uniref:Major facilitator superfamily (MFS) profile domain-containing protein n=1 Tax=Pichia inconspicua TaxID=52247 RepID=A0A4T0WX20_9ASCO|nr:hypothetical protein CANINC_004154 [[Candida] inconspicua]